MSYHELDLANIWLFETDLRNGLAIPLGPKLKDDDFKRFFKELEILTPKFVKPYCELTDKDNSYYLNQEKNYDEKKGDFQESLTLDCIKVKNKMYAFLDAVNPLDMRLIDSENYIFFIFLKLRQFETSHLNVKDFLKYQFKKNAKHDSNVLEFFNVSLEQYKNYFSPSLFERIYVDFKEIESNFKNRGFTTKTFFRIETIDEVLSDFSEKHNYFFLTSCNNLEKLNLLDKSDKNLFIEMCKNGYVKQKINWLGHIYQLHGFIKKIEWFFGLRKRDLYKKVANGFLVKGKNVSAEEITKSNFNTKDKKNKEKELASLMEKIFGHNKSPKN